MINTIGVLLLMALEALALYCAFKAIATARTPQGAVAWTVFLLSAPWLGVPAYMFLGHSRYPGYVAARRASREVIADLDALRVARGAVPDAAARVAAFERLAAMPAVSGNAVDLLVDGEETFRAVFAAIDGARDYLLVQFYIIKDDELGRAFKDRLIARAREGVSVRLIYDAIGCIKLPQSYLDELRAAGVDARDFHSIRQPAHRFQLNFRNHRKIVIADGEIALVGGHNVGDEYMGRDPRFGAWRDTHVRLRGPAAAQLQLVFWEDWRWATGELPELNWAAEPVAENLDALILASGPSDPMETGSLYFCNAIDAATERVWIASPYFVPDIDILSSLKLAALRGVDVRVLVPERRDHLIVWLAAFAYFDEVCEAGVQIWRYGAGFMHQKALVVDETIASVGTINLDNRSFRLNFEVTAIVFGAEAARATAAMLERDFARSRLDETPLHARPALPRYGA